MNPRTRLMTVLGEPDHIIFLCVPVSQDSLELHLVCCSLGFLTPLHFVASKHVTGLHFLVFVSVFHQSSKFITIVFCGYGYILKNKI